MSVSRSAALLCTRARRRCVIPARRRSAARARRPVMRGTISTTAGTTTARSVWHPRGRHLMRTACTSTATRCTAMAVALDMGRTDAEPHEYQLREIGRADKSAVRFALLQIPIL